MLRSVIAALLVTGFLLASGCSSDEAAPDTETAAAESSDAASETADATGAMESTEPIEVMTTDSGLRIEVLEEGDGEEIAAGQTAVVHYTGWFYDEEADNNRGDKFDSSRDRGEPFAFPVGAGRVIRGWDEGVQGMQVGERRILVIPPSLGYGPNDYGPIPGNSTLLFDVELLEIRNTQ